MNSIKTFKTGIVIACFVAVIGGLPAQAVSLSTSANDATAFDGRLLTAADLQREQSGRRATPAQPVSADSMDNNSTTLSENK